jgi:hypothetical protein
MDNPKWWGRAGIWTINNPMMAGLIVVDPVL